VTQAEQRLMLKARKAVANERKVRAESLDEVGWVQGREDGCYL